jgi:hypothetical protein
VGIISIVFGVLGMITYAWACIGPFFMNSMAAFANDPTMKATAQVQKDMLGWIVGSSGLNLLASLLLFVCGIGMTARRAWSTRLARTWAVSKMLIAIFAAVVTFFVQKATYAAMSSQSAPASPAATMAAMGGAFAVGTAIFTIAWSWAYPIFMLIWLSRPKVRAEYSKW